MEDTSIDKLLGIKVTQIQLVRDRGFQITERDKDIIKFDNDDNFREFYKYLISLDDKPSSISYWVNRGFLTQQALKYLGEGVGSYVAKLNVTSNPIFVKTIEHKLNWHLYWNEDYSKALLIYYDNKVNSQVSISTVKSFKNVIDEAERLYAQIRGTSPYNKIVESILIADAKLSPQANKDMNDIPKSQMFLESELSYNPTLNIDNQIHSLVPKNEVKALLKELKADKHGLETFKSKDPTIKYYGWKEGDIIKITRTDHGISILSPNSVNYKLVVV